MSAVLLLLLMLLRLGNSQQRTLHDVKPEELTFFMPAVPVVSTEQLQDVLNRAQSLREKAAQQPAAVAAAIAAAVGTLPPINFNQAFRVMKLLPAEVHRHLPAAVDLLARIRGLGTAAECRKRRGIRGPPDSPRILIAANLHDCEEIMPYWILEVLHLGLLLQDDPVLYAVYAYQAAPNPQVDLSKPPVQRTGISVYESGSTDRTPVWLQVAEALWSAAGLEATVVVNGSLTRQTDLLDSVSGRLYKQHRIQHLADLRNAALAPLYRRSRVDISSSSSSSSSSAPYYDDVMFVNDIFFCAPDLLRLSHLQADMACGIDVEVWIGGHVPKIRDAGHRNRDKRLRRLQHLEEDRDVDEVPTLSRAATSTIASAAAMMTPDSAESSAAPLTDHNPAAQPHAGAASRHLSQAQDQAGGGGKDSTASSSSGGGEVLAADPAHDLRAAWQLALELMTRVRSAEAARQEEANRKVQEAVIKPQYEFYDTWASRDIGGSAFIKHDPLARDLRTVDLLHRGMPFPVKCCWNGAVLFNASHLAAGLRFRSGMRSEGECDASECSLFCEDYRRLGSGRVAIDPSVRVSYAPWTEEIHGPLPGGLPGKVPFSAVKRGGALDRVRGLWQETREDMWMECMPLRKGFDGADLDRVHRVDLRRDNFTALFLERLGRPAPSPSRSCNLVMGPYGAADDGDFFDDLSYASWGKNPISRLLHRADSEFVTSIQALYGKTPAKQHGGNGGELKEHLVEAGEFINSAVVYYDERAVHGMELGTSVGRRIVVGHLRGGAVRRAKAVPCPADPAHEGRYRLIAFAGTADRYLRSVTLMWS